MTEDERRTSERIEAVVVVELENGLHGITRNVSGSGLLIATRTRFVQGDRIELTLHTKSGPRPSVGRVIRVDETPREEAWRFRIAVELEEPLPEAVIEDGVQLAAKFLGRASSIPPRP